MLKSYSLKHECREELQPLLLAHRDVVNRILEELWSHIEWKKKEATRKEAVEAPTKVQGGHPQQGVQEEAQGKPPPRVAFRSPLGGLRDKDRLLNI